MKTSSEKPRKVNAKMTKAQLIETLTDAFQTLEEQEHEIAAFQQQVKALKKAQKKAASTPKPNKKQGEIAAAKSIFRIELYNPSDGEWQGRIEYLLTKQKETFQGLDMEAIETFMRSYMPETSEKGGSLEKLVVEKPQPSPAIKAEPAAPTPPMANTKATLQKIKESQLKISLSQNHQAVNAIQSQIPAELLLEFAPSTFSEKTISVEIQLLASPLNGRLQKSKTLVKENFPYDPKRQWNYSLLPGKLPAGTYRLHAFAAVVQKNKVTTEIQASRLVRVSG